MGGIIKMQNGKKRIMGRSIKLTMAVIVVFGISGFLCLERISIASESSPKSLLASFAGDTAVGKNDFSQVDVVKIGMGMDAGSGEMGQEIAAQYQGKAPFRVTFDSKQLVGPMESYSWNFGDGETAQGPVTSHTFFSEGTYFVTLVVKEKTGEVQEKQLKVLVGTPGDKS
ncbi:PKD domain-containing protein [Desulforhopalus sp. IMCC35007]|nr:PKD domain-containing protein [Desulforhopalus sp. IMCC35007]